MTKERAAKIIIDMINGAESTFGHSLSTTEINALKKGYCALNPEPSTNADRIRSMTDEKLADELVEWFACFSAVEWTREMICDWLKQECDDENK